MYVPAAFSESERDAVLDFVDAHPFGALVTAEPGTGLFATHLPFVLDRTRGPYGVLQGHVARANPHARSTARDALVIFTGPDAYVHPGWYPSKREHGRVVPTWNYVAVHAAGTLRLIEDAGFLMRHLETITARHEAGHAHPWSISDAPAGFVERLVHDTIGVEVEVARLDGKWKMSQNRPAADIAGVVTGLAASSSPHHQAVAALVHERRPPSKR